MAEDHRQEQTLTSLSQRWLAILHDAATIANQAGSPDRALETILERVTVQNGWYAGFAKLQARERQFWSTLPGEIPSTETEDRIRRFARAWADRVMERGATHLIVDFTEDHEAEFESRDRLPDSGGGVATPIRLGGLAIGAMAFVSHHPLSHNLDPQALAELGQVMDNISVQIAHIVERYRLIQRITRETELERQALGRQVHDGLAQQLVAIKLMAQNMRRRVPQPSGTDSSEKWRHLIEAITQAQTEAHALAHGLDADALLTESEDSVVVLLEALVDVVKTAYEVDCELSVVGSAPVADQYIRSQLLRIAREAVFNALRHADPERLRIRLAGDETGLVLSIRDDGSGLKRDGAAFEEGMGIASMRYRASLIGATLEIESEPGRGTLVECTLDYD